MRAHEAIFRTGNLPPSLRYWEPFWHFRNYPSRIDALDVALPAVVVVAAAIEPDDEPGPP